MSATPDQPTIHQPTVVRVADLRPHPENYRRHPARQIAEISASIREHGVYRNVVLANDGETILAGHGVVETAAADGVEEILAVLVPYPPDDPRAIRILTADNELSRLAEDDDRRLAELLARLNDDGGLSGTGHDDESLATLLRILAARDADPTTALDAWRGMPAFRQDDRESAFHTTVHFATEEDADRFFDTLGIARGRSVWWPEHDGHVGSDAGEAWVHTG